MRERRRAEEEVRRLNEGLEQRVAQRTGQLQAETERLAVTLRSIGDGVIATDITRPDRADEPRRGADHGLTVGAGRSGGT